ncbi:E2/UBC family protein [Microbacterium panaciterrae]|uniref:Uncharacterized protein n=1 Tax=Microbacterium panaciterrae TaxID=985759 RepID=A0ABP8P6E7_9MICO
MALIEDIQTAIGELSVTFPGSSITVEESGDGSAWVRLEPVPTGKAFTPSTTWLLFQIPYNYPDADIYPHFVTPNLKRADGALLGEGLHQPVGAGPGGAIQATQVSRRTNQLDAGTHTAAGKALKVLQWLEER